MPIAPLLKRHHCETLVCLSPSLSAHHWHVLYIQAATQGNLLLAVVLLLLHVRAACKAVLLVCDLGHPEDGREKKKM
jgi:hypothetical protein